MERAGSVPSSGLYKALKEVETCFVRNQARIVVGATELSCYTLSFTTKRPALQS